jgi:hypothetical protein
MITEEQIRQCVAQFEEEWEFSDNLIYKGCLKASKEINLCEVKTEDVKGPIRTFLINWGMMGRVLGGKKYKDWGQNLANVTNCDKLNNLRDLDLINSDLKQIKFDIENCYGSVRKIVGPTSASKILHLICSNFFPMWDEDIRKWVSRYSRYKEIHKNGIGPSREGYYKFMQVMQILLEKYNRVLSELSEQRNKCKLKILDEFLWKVAHQKNGISV